MSVINRKKELYEKHEHISLECSKINKFICLAFEKSDNAIQNVININDNEFLHHFTKIYKYLSQLHLELMDISCHLELYFMNTQDDYPRLLSVNNSESDNNTESNKLFVINNYLENWKTKSECSVTSSSQPAISNDSLSIKIEDLNKNEDVRENFETSNGEEFKLNQEQNETQNNLIQKLFINSENDIFSLKTDKRLQKLHNSIDNFESLSSISSKEESSLGKNQIDNIVDEINPPNLLEEVKLLESNSPIIQMDKNFETSTDFAFIFNDVKQNTDMCNKPASPENSVNNLSKDLSHLPSLPDPNEGDLCCLGYVESPSCFYIQLACEEASLIDEFSAKIEEHIDNCPFYNKKSEAMSVLTPYCACYYEQSQEWLRGQVVDWLPDIEDEVKVHMIDYGFTVNVPLTNLRQLPDELLVVPKMIFKCHLAWVEPPNKSRDIVNEWPMDSITFFRETVKPLVHCLFTVTYVERMGDSLGIDLSTEEIPSLIGIMLSTNKAKSILPDLENIPSTSSLQMSNNVPEQKTDEPNTALLTDFMKQQIKISQGFDLSDTDDEECLEEYTNPNLAVAHYDPRDERRVCKFLGRPGGCWKLNCRFSHEPLHPDGWTMDKELVYYRAFNSVMLPNAGITAKVKIKCIKDLRTFYVHVKSFPDMNNSIYQPVNSLKNLIQMMNYPDEVKKHKVPVVCPALSQIILVQYCDTWQRARVLEITGPDTDIRLEVLVVDYGETLVVGMKETREIKEKYLHFPFQAVRCVLNNTALKEDLSEEQIQTGLDYLEMCSLEKTLEAKIIYSSSHLSVLLYDEDGQDIGEQLIHAGLVNRSTIDLSIKPHTNKYLVD